MFSSLTSILSSRRWAPSWIAPLVLVWPGFIVGAVVSGAPLRPQFLYGAAAYSLLAASPFAILGAFATWPPDVESVRRAAIVGGFIATALVWVPTSVDIVADAVGSGIIGWGWMIWIFVVLGSPIIVAGGMWAGSLVASPRRRAG